MMRRNLIPAAVVAPRRMDRLSHDAMFTPMLSDLLAPFPAPGTNASLQVRETEEAYTVRCELPGYEQEEVQVELTGDLLAIRAERKARENGWQTQASYANTLRLADPIDAGKVGAELKNGVLLVTLPKSEAARPRKIAINSGQPAAAQIGEPAVSERPGTDGAAGQRSE